MSEETTIEVTLSAAERDRLQAVTDDPAALLREAGMRRVTLEEAIAATGGDRVGPATTDEFGAERPVAPVGVTVGFRPVSMGEGEATVALEAGPEHANPMGTVHGGVICDVGDAAMGISFATTLEADESFTTLQLDANYLRPVREGRLTATATVVHRGRTVGLVECDVTDADDRLVARLSSTCMVLRGEAADGR